MNVEKIRLDFPSLAALRNKKPVHYLDSACMSLRPKQVIDKSNEYYIKYPACAGRSYHAWANKVTEEVGNAREKIRKFINARKTEEIIFTKNATESINLVAASYPLKQGDVVLTLDKEHNSNLLPWQVLAKKGIIHDIVKTDDDNTFSMEHLETVLKKYKGKVRLAAFGQTANLDGVTIPAKDIIRRLHKEGIIVLLDACQTIPHHKIDVRSLDADFLAFSGHKMCGPSGIGVLYGKKEMLDKLQPLCIGGETVIDSTYTSFTPETLPHRLEGGLQNYAGIIGLGAACDYLSSIGHAAIEKQELLLNTTITDSLQQEISRGDIGLIGPNDPKLRGCVFNIILSRMDSHEAAIMLDQRNVMVRSGAHCVHSWFNARKKKTSLRASLYFYNNEEDVDAFVSGVKDILKLK
jgi:cysteine desulfurase/selenocysteine lyase